MCDVGEGATVNECGVVFQRLHQVRLHCFFQQHGHGSVCFQFARGDRRAVAPVGNDDVAEPLLQIFEIGRQAEDGHDFGRNGDVEPCFTRKAVGNATKRTDDGAQCAIVHVHHPAPDNAANVDAQFVAPVDVVLDQGCEQVVGRGDGVEVTGEMQVDVFHRDDLGIAATGCAALHAETRAERRFTQADHRVLADPVETVAKTDRCGRLAFACGVGLIAVTRISLPFLRPLRLAM